MSKFEEVINKSHDNLAELSKGLAGLHALESQINEILALPDAHDQKVKNIVSANNAFIESIDKSTQNYLESNHKELKAKMDDFNKVRSALQIEVNRLTEVDFANLFTNIQEQFVAETTNSFEQQLEKVDARLTEFSNNNKALRSRIEELNQIDLEAHFKAHEHKLSDIFGAVNQVNSTLIQTNQSLSTIANEVGATKASVAEVLQKTTALQGSVESLIKENTNHFTTIHDGLKFNKVISLIIAVLVVIIGVVYFATK